MPDRKDVHIARDDEENQDLDIDEIFAGVFGGPRDDEDEDNQDLDIEELMTGDVHDME